MSNIDGAVYDDAHSGSPKVERPAPLPRNAGRHWSNDFDKDGDDNADQIQALKPGARQCPYCNKIFHRKSAAQTQMLYNMHMAEEILYV